ncbi:MAG: hypothetical protein BWY31_04663 [Lentisphaerae bacterium ADurb.Bin242]|nr:MAG: hypothetical protein BWY31_04663 [Lentisphaerae bacterium ADurb.Bin242]
MIQAVGQVGDPRDQRFFIRVQLSFLLIFGGAVCLGQIRFPDLPRLPERLVIQTDRLFLHGLLEVHRVLGVLLLLQHRFLILVESFSLTLILQLALERVGLLVFALQKKSLDLQLRLVLGDGFVRVELL